MVVCMLDDRCDCLLDFINRECSEGSYRVFDPSELIAAFPAEYAVDSDGLFLMLDYLAERDYVVVKYRDGEAVCLAPLPKGRRYHEEKQEAGRREADQERFVRRSFWAGAAGGGLGGLLGGLLVLLAALC